MQINDDSIDLAQTTTLETTMHNIWQKGRDDPGDKLARSNEGDFFLTRIWA